MSPSSPFVYGCAAFFGAVLLLTSGALALREFDSLGRAHDTPKTVAISLVDQDIELDAVLSNAPDLPEEIAATYEGVFLATIDYTPLESGFLRELGFDVRPATKPGLLGKMFPREFLRAVEIEGFGRMKSPIAEKFYVRYCGGRWSYADHPLDSSGKRLRPLRSTAISACYEMIQPQATFRVRASGLPEEFQKAEWTVCDTGSGLRPRQIDFHWGEDVPFGPGRQLTRPRGMPHPVTAPTILVLR